MRDNIIHLPIKNIRVGDRVNLTGSFVMVHDVRTHANVTEVRAHVPGVPYHDPYSDRPGDAPAPEGDRAVGVRIVRYDNDVRIPVQTFVSGE